VRFRSPVGVGGAGLGCRYDRRRAPYGSWLTPITSELVVAAAVRLGEVRVDGVDPVWSELRPAEGGRTQLVRRRGADSDGGPVDLLPAGFDARTAVHEYGGAAWWVRDGVTWFTNWGRPAALPPGARVRPGAADRRAPGAEG